MKESMCSVALYKTHSDQKVVADTIETLKVKGECLYWSAERRYCVFNGSSGLPFAFQFPRKPGLASVTLSTKGQSF